MANPTSASARRRDLDTEHRILEAANAVFLRRGTAGARMQEIAEEAGVNQALLHYYFKSKDGLATAVFRAAAARILPAVMTIVASDLPLEQKVERFVATYIDEIRQRPFIPAYIISELHHHPERLLSSLVGAASVAPHQVFRARLVELQAQIDVEVAAGRLRPIAAVQFLLNTVSLTVFPFLAQPLLRIGAGIDDGAFERLLDERRADLPGMIMRGLRP